MKLVLYVAAGFAVVLLAVTLIAQVQAPPTGLALFALWILFAIAPFGAFWMMYMAVRYEREPVSLIVLALFVPFAFLWYYFERVRPRKRRQISNLPVANKNMEAESYKGSRLIKTALLIIVGAGLYAFAFWVIFTPGIPSQFPLFVPLAATVFFVHPIGAWWLIYMVVRHEKRVFPLILLSCVPLGFVWYYFERVRGRIYKSRQLA